MSIDSKLAATAAGRTPPIVIVTMGRFEKELISALVVVVGVGNRTRLINGQ